MDNRGTSHFMKECVISIVLPTSLLPCLPLPLLPLPKLPSPPPHESLHCKSQTGLDMKALLYFAVNKNQVFLLVVGVVVAVSR